MLFNSIEFALFLPVVFALYWFASRKLAAQNILLLIASYFFYSCWDFRFLFLLIFSTALDYFSGIVMSDTINRARKKFWFWFSILANLGFLGVFKYYNFFAESFADALSQFGLQANPATLEVILPVGISFYTFHGLSYVIDVYYDRIKPERNFVTYSLFVSFFPLLVAGPIERATHLLPQIRATRTFDYKTAVDGLRQILWGLFKKIVIADQCAKIVNVIFDGQGDASGSTLIFGAVLFAFQIYCDFSGYSDIALGTAKLFGIRLLRNFAYPYFSRDIAEFWRRWHISLSTWFRDYLYIPLGGSKTGTVKKIRNVLIIFLVSGFWHGANWTFVVWGFLNALFIIPLMWMNTNRNNLEIAGGNRILPSAKEFLQIVLTFSLTTFAWIFFRSETIDGAFDYISGIASLTVLSIPDHFSAGLLVLLLLLIASEWMARHEEHPLARLPVKWFAPVRWAVYYFLVFLIFKYAGTEQQFIYFQF